MRSMSQSQASLEGPGLLSAAVSLRSDGGLIFPVGHQGFAPSGAPAFGFVGGPGTPGPGTGGAGGGPVPEMRPLTSVADGGRAPPPVTPPAPPPPAPSPSHRSLDWAVPEEPPGLGELPSHQEVLMSTPGASGPGGEMAVVPECGGLLPQSLGHAHVQGWELQGGLTGFVPSPVMSSAPPPPVGACRFLRGPSPSPGSAIAPGVTPGGALPPSPAMRPRSDSGGGNVGQPVPNHTPTQGSGPHTDAAVREIRSRAASTLGMLGQQQPPHSGALGVAWAQGPPPGGRGGARAQFVAPAPAVYTHGARVHCGLVTPRLFSGA